MIRSRLLRRLLLVVDGKKRRPDEDVVDFMERRSRERRLKIRHIKQLRREWGSRAVMRDYVYVTLNCDHIVREIYPLGNPSVGDAFWCWGHRPGGPTQLQRVVAVSHDRPEPIVRKSVLI